MHVPQRMPPASRRTGRGWVRFAGVMLLIGSTLNALYGFFAIYNDGLAAHGFGDDRP